MDDPYWTQYITLFDTASEVTTLLDTSSLLLADRSNLVTLVQFLSGYVFNFLERGDAATPKACREILNCVRVLGRTIPFLSSGGELDQTEQFFWRTTRVRLEQAETEQGQFVVDDEAEEGYDATSEQEWRNIPALASRLLASLVDLAYVPGFTLSEGSDVVYVIW